MADDRAEGFMIRLARREELPLLTEIELDAFVALAKAQGRTRTPHALPQESLRQSLDDDLLFVAADAQDRPIGFIAAVEQDETLYIKEIDVTRSWQGRGVGKRLIASAIDAARACRLSGVTLTTDRDVPFNAPFYAKLGFVEIGKDDGLPILRRALAAEVADAEGGARRVAMVLWFGGN